MNGLPDLTAHDVVQFGARVPKMHVTYASIYRCDGAVPGAVRLTKSTLAGEVHPLDLAEGIVGEAILEHVLRTHWSDIEPLLLRHIVRYEEEVAELQEWFDQADPDGFEWQTPDAFVPELEEAKTRLADARALLELLKSLVA